MRAALPVRILGVLVAMAACAWFVIGIRQSQATDAASRILASPGRLTPLEARRAAQLLRTAAQLNPDRGVDLLRSQLALREGEPARARSIALSVASAEPQSIDAWLAYGSASARDPAAFRRALRHLEQLAPNVR